MKKAILILLTAAMMTAPLTAMAKDITLKIGDENATVDGETVTLDSAPVIQNDHTMLPIRFIAENFGFDVIWNAADKEVTISSKEKESKGMNIKFKTDEEIKAETAGAITHSAWCTMARSLKTRTVR